MLQALRSAVELPLLKREMIELAQLKRTYALRCLCLGVFALVFLVMYVSIRQRAANITWMLGQGREITYVLFFTLIATIYALAPAMACAAITSEKEKQTLGLLLTSKLSPLGIVLEKIFSRMVPLLSLVTVSAPLFGVAYLFGGISFVESAIGISCLLYIVFQIAVVAVFCSALVETSMAAFWLSYLILAAFYFTLPVLYEMTRLGIREMIPGLPSDPEFLFFPIYQMVVLAEGNRTLWQILYLTVPSLLVTLAFIPAATYELTCYGYGQATSFKVLLLKLQGKLSVTTARWLPRSRLKQCAQQAIIDADSPLSERVSTDFPQTQPILWREKRGTLLLRPRMLLMLFGGLFLTEVWALSSARRGDHDEFCAFFSFAIQILAVLIVLSLASKLFAKERERQTLDALLVAPLTNRELLQHKAATINRVILLLMIPILVAGLFNVTHTKLRISTLTASPQLLQDNAYYYRRSAIFGVDWLAACLVYLTCLLGTAFINLHLSKWIALSMGLHMKTQIRGMIGSLVSILMLCLLPMILLALVLISFDADPDDFPLWFFSSPAIFVVVNEFHDLSMMFRRSFLPNSDVMLIMLNFAVYGGLIFALRRFVLYRLPQSLSRLDQAEFDPAQAAQRPEASNAVWLSHING